MFCAHNQYQLCLTVSNLKACLIQVVKKGKVQLQNRLEPDGPVQEWVRRIEDLQPDYERVLQVRFTCWSMHVAELLLNHHTSCTYAYVNAVAPATGLVLADVNDAMSHVIGSVQFCELITGNSLQQCHCSRASCMLTHADTSCARLTLWVANDLQQCRTCLHQVLSCCTRSKQQTDHRQVCHSMAPHAAVLWRVVCLLLGVLCSMMVRWWFRGC